ncbi:unnamed protein product [Malus baccata var. baccata]
MVLHDRQLVHDYAWDPVICDPMMEFPNVGVGDESLENVKAFSERFRGFFENVNDAFVSRDIQCSWVDVRYELECGEGKAGNDEDKTRFGFFESGVRSLGWRFCSTGWIILGSAFVSFEIMNSQTKGGKLKELFWGHFVKGVTKFQVKALQKYNEFLKFKGHLIGSSPSLSEDQTSLVKSGATDDLVSAEVLKLPPRDPKDITARQKSSGPSVKASDSESEGLTSGKIVRDIAESMKQKFVKQICSFLEKVRCHLEGFFGDWSVDDYTLEDVVHKIYTKMDLLLFADEEELPNCLLNSEDGNRSCKEKPKSVEVDESYRIWDSLSAEGESLRPLKTDIGRPSAEEIKQKEDHARKLLEAQERRERARRFASSTRWMPDLQRVWAPKQLKPLKPKSNPLRKLFKRKDHRGSCDDRVCETPMTGIKRSCSQRSWDDDEDYRDYSSQPCGSVSKALFQDDDQ